MQSAAILKKNLLNLEIRIDGLVRKRRDDFAVFRQNLAINIPMIESLILATYSPEEIGEVVVAFPLAIAEQRQIVSKLDSLAAETQRLTQLYKQKLTALSELKKSLLHQAFTGEL
jgi:hypothetical protein